MRLGGQQINRQCLTIQFFFKFKTLCFRYQLSVNEKEIRIKVYTLNLKFYYFLNIDIHIPSFQEESDHYAISDMHISKQPYLYSLNQTSCSSNFIGRQQTFSQTFMVPFSFKLIWRKITLHVVYISRFKIMYQKGKSQSGKFGYASLLIIVVSVCFNIVSADRTKQIHLVQYILVQLMTQQFENYTLYNMVEKGLQRCGADLKSLASEYDVDWAQNILL